MEEQYSSKLGSKLLVFEKSSKEWEWSDLIKWLSGLKQVIEKYEVPVPSDQIYILSKRLGQCLYPSLPHGLHSKTLEIYSSLLSNAPMLHISLLSTGLFPHFQFCAPQNKPQFLELISQKYITRFNEVHYTLQGLFSCLLAGANDTADTFAKVSEILDQCASINKELTHKILWWFILKSDKHRLSGLIYMQKRMDTHICKRRILNALLESLDTNSIMIRRSALDLIRHFYPLDGKDKKSVVILMEGALKLVTSKDHTLLRRIWEWVFPNEFDDERVNIVTEILQAAVFNIFLENHSKIESQATPDDFKMLSIKIAESLSEHEGIGESILYKIAVRLVRHTVVDKLYIVKGLGDNRVKDIFSGTHSKLFWRAYEESMETLLNENEEEALEILKFAVFNFEFSYDTFYTIFSVLFMSLPYTKHINLVLEILNIIINYVEIPGIHLDSTINLYRIYLEDSNQLVLPIFTDLFSFLIRKGIDVPEIVPMLYKYTEKNFLSGVALILKLDKGVSGDIIIKLLKLVSTVSHVEVCNLITSSCEVSGDEWNLSIVSLLIHTDITIQEFYMRKFISYWGYMEKNNPSSLDYIARNTKIVFIMIDQLGSQNPITKHQAKEWLCIAQNTINHIVDPVLKILLHKSTIRDLNSDGFYAYSKIFDNKRVEDAISKTILIVSVGGKDIVKQMTNTNVSEYSRIKCKRHNIHTDLTQASNTYLSLLINLMVLYIQTPVISENIIGYASELLSIIVKDLPGPLIDPALNSCIEIVYKILPARSKIEIYILKVLKSLFTFNKVIIKYQSKFTDILVLGLKNERKRLRKNWMSFINLTLPFIINSINVPDLTTYLHSLFYTYYEIILHYSDFSLVPGLSTLIRFGLDINNKKQTNLMHVEVKDMIKKQIDKILLVLLRWHENSQSDNVSDINDLIIPIASMFQYEIIQALLDLWTKFSLHNPRIHELNLIIQITPNFNISPETIIDFLLKISENSHKEYPEELVIASFAQNIFIVLERFKIPVSGSALWNKVLSLIKYLSLSPEKEALIFQLNIIHILSSKISIDLRILRDLQDIIKNVSVQCADVLKWNQLAFNVCYYSFEANLETVCQKMIKTLIYRSSFVFDILWSIDQEKKKNELIVALISSLISELKNYETGGELAGELVLNFFKIGNSKINEGIKAGLINFYKNDLFEVLQRYPKSIKSWESIIYMISTKYYAEKSSFLADLMYYYEPSFWYRNETVLSLLYQSSALMCFIIFSSPKKAYSSLVSGIAYKIKEILKQDYIIPSHLKILCLLLKVLYLRLKKTEFEYIWKIVWPDLSIIFFKFFKDVDLLGTFEVLKFLDFMLATGFERSELIGLYLFDLPEIELIEKNTQKFKPAVSKNFLSGYSAEPSKAIRKNFIVHTHNKRKLLLQGQNPELLEDLDRFVKILIQFCTFYSSEIVLVDFENIEASIETDICNINEYKY